MFCTRLQTGLRRFFRAGNSPLDDHLVGSIGAVVAAYMFGLALLPGSSKGHDAAAPDGRRVEVKFTQGGSVTIRHEPDHLIVLQRRKGASVQIVFNGPGTLAWSACGALQKKWPATGLDLAPEAIGRRRATREPLAGSSPGADVSASQNGCI